jgi:predicted tellurium resistance membrane protein TerC
MIAAMVIAVGVMLVFAAAIGEFVERHPSVKILALSFLLLIGVLLVAEGLGQHVDKGYVYFAMAFSLTVELLNIRRSKALKPVQLRSPFEEPPRADTAA